MRLPHFGIVIRNTLHGRFVSLLMHTSTKHACYSKQARLYSLYLLHHLENAAKVD